MPKRSYNPQQFEKAKVLPTPLWPTPRNFFCKTGPQKLSFPAQLTGEELKDQLREPLGVSAETPLALTFQNGNKPQF